MSRVNVASALIEGVELKLRRPVLPLRLYLGCFWAFETNLATRLRVIPDGCTTIAIEASESRSPQCFFVGPRRSPGERVPGSGQLFVGVRLHPGVAFGLIGIP